MRFLYTILYTVGFVLLSPVLFYKLAKRGNYRPNFFQRFGRYSEADRQKLSGKTRPRHWIHAASVGEMNLALVVIAAWRERWPQHQLIVTTNTVTGAAIARQRLPADAVLLYFPLDFPGCVRRAYDLIQPDSVLLVESELWPNHIAAAVQRQIPVSIINARVSPGSARWHRRFQWLFRRTFASLTVVGAQSEADAARLRELGAPRVELTGNIKYDAALPANTPVRIDLGLAGDRPVLVAGSTWPGEEEILFDILQNTPGLFLVLVPRHVERTPEIVALAKTKNIRFTLRKDGTPIDRPDCLIVNTTGELKDFYNVGTVIFVGKSLTATGGQNIVEAAASGHPIIFGPHMENFQSIAEEFIAARAGIQVPDAAGLKRAVAELVAQPAQRAEITAAAQRVLTANRGAVGRTLDLLGPQFRV